MFKLSFLTRAALAGAALVMMPAALAHAQQTPEAQPDETFPEPQQEPREPSPAVEDPAAPEDALVVLGELMSRDLQDARQSFIQREFPQSAAELRRAAVLVSVEAERAHGEPQADLERAQAGLEGLARDVEAGRVDDLNRFDTHLARAEHASARYYQQLADEAWQEQNPVRAGEALRSAARRLENAATWTGGEAVDIARDVTGDAFRVSGDLIEGAGYVPQQAASAIERLGEATERLGERIRGTDEPTEPASPE